MLFFMLRIRIEQRFAFESRRRPNEEEAYGRHLKLEQASRGGEWMDALQGAESHARSMLKAISWGTLGATDTFAISWFPTGRLTVAGSIAGLEFATKVVRHDLHERIWATIEWGRPSDRDGSATAPRPSVWAQHLLQRGGRRRD